VDLLDNTTPLFLLLSKYLRKEKRARVGGNARDSRTREATRGPQPYASVAADLDLESQSPQLVAIGAGQASMASLMLEKLMNPVNLRVKQELSAQAATPYLPHQ